MTRESCGRADGLDLLDAVSALVPLESVVTTACPPEEHAPTTKTAQAAMISPRWVFTSLDCRVRPSAPRPSYSAAPAAARPASWGCRPLERCADRDKRRLRQWRCAPCYRAEYSIPIDQDPGAAMTTISNRRAPGRFNHPPVLRRSRRACPPRVHIALGSYLVYGYRRRVRSRRHVRGDEESGTDLSVNGTSLGSTCTACEQALLCGHQQGQSGSGRPERRIRAPRRRCAHSWQAV